MKGRLVPAIAVALCLVSAWLAGCVSHAPAASSGGPDAAGESDTGLSALRRAETLYGEGDYGAALIECVDLAHRDPLTPGLPELQHKIMSALVEQRARQAALRAETARQQLAVETLAGEDVPDTYGVRKFVHGGPDSVATPPGAMDAVLDKTVSIHLKGVTLDALVQALSKDQNVNVIADKELGKGKSLDIEVDNVPLREILDYIARNMQIAFYVGQNVIWATAPGGKGTVPLETRIYRLTKGLQFHGVDWKVESKPVARILGLAGEATVLSDGPTYIEETIKRFTPQEEGADLLLDRNTHRLFVRNTRANLDVIEKIIAALDITPPQVLIEARFFESTVSDLRELGIDWILNGPLVTSSRYVLENGAWVKAPETQIDAGNAVQFTPYATGEQGAFPLGPQGAFSLGAEDGNKPTADQGLNIAFHGILTQPEFHAVLHALDISGKGRMLSVPRVTTVNNNPAKLRNGEDLRFFEEFQAQAFSLRDADNRPYTVTVLIPKGAPSIEETGITLVAVPSVGADLRTVSLLLMPTISRVERWTSYQDSAPTNEMDFIQQVVVKLPVISRKEVQTKVIVESGETVVLGGLIDTIKQDTLHRVPFLGSIPLLGKLFQRRDVTEQKRNLVIFVTAKVISERGETLVPY